MTTMLINTLCVVPGHITGLLPRLPFDAVPKVVPCSVPYTQKQGLTQERFKVCERESKTKAFSKVGVAT